MLKALWNKLNSPTAAGPAKVPARFERAALKMLMEYFPVGKKLRYYPEYRRDIVFDTVIIGYRANSHYIYSRDDVLQDGEGFPSGFRLSPNKVLPIEKLEKFQFLVPDTSDMEMTLDYFSRAEIGRAGQFRQGNTITLFIETEARGVPTVDTRVDRRQIMKTGPYADSSTILVTPEIDSLTIADKRRKQRVATNVRADLYVAVDSRPHPCVLGDFSEGALRLQVGADRQAMPPMRLGDKLVIEFPLGETAAPCRLRGKLFRRADDFCVIQIEHRYTAGDFKKVKMMDIIEIKTGLLNVSS